MFNSAGGAGDHARDQGFDLVAYEQYLAVDLQDFEYPEAEIKEAVARILG